MLWCIDFHAYIVYNISMKVGDIMNNVKDFMDKSGLLITKNAIKNGIKKDTFYNFIKKNHFEKIAQGIYASSETWVDEAFILNQQCPQAIFSHDEALFYHELIDREPLQQTVTIYSGYNTHRLSASGVKVFTVKKELLTIGKITYQNSFGHTIPVYDLERTICDLIRNRNSFEIQDFQSALKNYIARTDKNLNTLMEYAKLFRVDNIIRKYMEVLL